MSPGLQDWVLTPIADFRFGMTGAVADGGWSGTIDVDDVRATTTPPPTFVGLSASVATAPVGQCISLTLGLTDVQGLAAVAPYDVLVTLTVFGGSGITLSGVCGGMTVVAVVIPTGSANVSLFANATSVGGAQLEASNVDFLSGPGQPVAFTAPVPDAGVDAGVDAGMSMDAGSADAGAPDSGFDAGLDAGFDAGVDAGAATDAGLTPDAGESVGCRAPRVCRRRPAWRPTASPGLRL